MKIKLPDVCPWKIKVKWHIVYRLGKPKARIVKVCQLHILYIYNDKVYISPELVSLIYDKVEKNWVLRIETIQLYTRSIGNNRIGWGIEKTPYKALLIQDLEEEGLKPEIMQMKQWPILSAAIKNVQYNQHLLGHYGLEVNTSEERYGTKMTERLQDGQERVKNVGFNLHSERLKHDYLDVFLGVKSYVLYTARYDENWDIGITYLGTSSIRRQDELRLEHKMPITENCDIHGQLLDSTDCKILLDTLAAKSFVSKTLYLNCLSLHS